MFDDSGSDWPWADLWLSEGFATYFAGLFRERTEGKESFQAYMDEAAKDYFAYEKVKRTPIHDTETEDLMALLNANNYQKGAWVLHMLRGQLGDHDFFAGLRKYYADHRNGVATTDDLRTALEKVSGKDLGGFFQRWVYGAGHPVYDVTWRWIPHGRQGAVVISIDQTQPDVAFPNSLPIEFRMGSEVSRHLIKPAGKFTRVTFALAAKPESIQIDPESWVLKEMIVREVRVAAAGR